MIIYLHFEEDINIHFTKRYMISDQAKLTVHDIINSFCDDFNQCITGFSLVNDSVSLHTTSGRKLNLPRPLLEFVDHLEDYFVRFISVTINDNSVRENLKMKNIKENKADSNFEMVTTNSNTCAIEDYDKFRCQIKELLSKKQYRQVRILCENVINDSTLINNSSLGAIIALESLMKVKMECNDGQAAAGHLRKAIKIASKLGHSTIGLQLNLVKALMLEKEYDDAFSVVSDILSVIPHDRNALEYLSLKAEILFELGRVSEAGETINRCITPPLASESNPMGNLAVLLSYGYISMSCQPPLVEQPLSALLRALSMQADNKRVRELLAKLLNAGYSSDLSRKEADDSRGLQELFRQLSSTGSSRSSSAPAFALLANVCKDHSAMQPCIRLLKTSLGLEPQSASYALNLMHALEIVGDVEGAINTLVFFCEQNPSLAITSPVSPQPVLTCQDLLAAVRGQDDFVAAADAEGERWFYSFRRRDEDIEVYLHCPSATDPASSTITQLSSQTGVRKTLSDSELDLLALSFTAAKLFFLQGRLSLLPALFRLLEPVRSLSGIPLHTTLVRNEHAYYQAIGQLLAHKSASFLQLQTYRPPLTDVSVSAFPLYMLGDSHSLTSAWSELPGQRLLVPKLVTGVKQWHLRARGDFYPKAHFQCMVDSIPNGAEVVVLVGEIDCREGMLLAVERDKYPSVEEAMRSTLQQFMQVLISLVKRKRFKVFVHPVPPVLRETRHLVLAYNVLYEQAIKALPKAYAESIKWLDLLPQLLEASPLVSEVLTTESASLALSIGARLGQETHLKEELALDGTHLSPAYVPLLLEALRKAACV